MSLNQEKSEKLLRKHGLRVTHFRTEVLEAFLGTDVALSNQDLEKKLEDPDRITLYRTLKSFQNKGLIHKAIDGTDTARYAVCSSDCDEHEHHDEHIHFHCRICENTFCIDGIKVPDVEAPKGFILEKTSMVVEGICEKCG